MQSNSKPPIEIRRPTPQVAEVWLNRPEVRNAFNEEVIAALTQVFTDLSEDPVLRVIVLGAHGKAFCAGADLNWMRRMADYSEQENLADAATMAEMLHRIHSCSKPTIARIQGDVFAGGMGLVAACDMAVSVDSANYCLSEVKLGLIPATISPYVIRAMGERVAQRYFLTAERFNADQALRMGLLHEVVTPDALDAKVAELVAQLLAASPNAVREAKQLVHDVAGRDITPELIASTVTRIAKSRASQDGREGVQAFLQKRQPSWSRSD